MTAPKIQFTRRQILAGASALPLFSIGTRYAHAAEFELKYATGQDPTHPVNIRAKQAHDRIREATSGRVDIKLFPANQLGSDTDLLTQVRNGSVDFFNLSSLILATFVPISGITSDGPHGGARTVSGGDEQLLIFNITNPPAMRDNIRQSALELVLTTGEASGNLADHGTLIGHNRKERKMGRGLLLWLIGVPIPIIILILLFWR